MFPTLRNAAGTVITPSTTADLNALTNAGFVPLNNAAPAGMDAMVWADYIAQVDALFGAKKITLSVSNTAADVIALGGFYKFDRAVVGIAGVLQNSTNGGYSNLDYTLGAANTTTSSITEFPTTAVSGLTVQTPSLAQLARFCASNPIAVSAIRVTQSSYSTQLSTNFRIQEQLSGNNILETINNNVSLKPNRTVDQFQTTIVNVTGNEPAILSGTSFITYGLVAKAAPNSLDTVIELAYSEVGNQEDSKATRQFFDFVAKYGIANCNY